MQTLIIDKESQIPVEKQIPEGGYNVINYSGGSLYLRIQNYDGDQYVRVVAVPFKQARQTRRKEVGYWITISTM